MWIGPNSSVPVELNPFFVQSIKVNQVDDMKCEENSWVGRLNPGNGGNDENDDDIRRKKVARAELKQSPAVVGPCGPRFQGPHNRRYRGFPRRPFSGQNQSRQMMKGNRLCFNAYARQRQKLLVAATLA
ncbi:PREDICTED: uncharacterized protein LOC104806622 isoform X2 [Tarenaya hassleriana]|uniref:uncharacterized protein LOC104806622 isoform X2 n=1 Tax=Tarenaya hassleriana TaxID=28532 RepID=UPI00053C9969|nr:PREDICTED: uncharacterized protein LOC104806622 isoform X2 [Tarenaya hassleriana]